MTSIENEIMLLLGQLNPNRPSGANEPFTLSSLEYLNFLVEIESRFHIEVEDTLWKDGAFQTIHQIARYIELLDGGKNVDF